MSVTIRYGLDNSLTKPAAEISSVRDILNSTSLQAVLGFSPDNTQALVNGITQDSNAMISDGDVVELRTVAARKG